VPSRETALLRRPRRGLRERERWRERWEKRAERLGRGRLTSLRRQRKKEKMGERMQ
jgi:hypothetical protein